MDFNEVYQKARLLESQYGKINYNDVLKTLTDFEKQYDVNKTFKQNQKILVKTLEDKFGVIFEMEFGISGSYNRDGFKPKKRGKPLATKFLNCKFYFDIIDRLKRKKGFMDETYSHFKSTFLKSVPEDIIKKEWNKFQKSNFNAEKDTLIKDLKDTRNEIISTFIHESTHEQQYATDNKYYLNLANKKFREWAMKTYPESRSVQLFEQFNQKSLKALREAVQKDPEIQKQIFEFMDNEVFDFTENYRKFYNENYLNDYSELEAFATNICYDLSLCMSDVELWNLINHPEDVLRLIKDDRIGGGLVSGAGLKRLAGIFRSDKKAYNIFFDHMKDFFEDNF